MTEYEIRSRLAALQTDFEQARRALGVRLVAETDARAARRRVASIRQQIEDCECMLLAIKAAEKARIEQAAQASVQRIASQANVLQESSRQFEEALMQFDGSMSRDVRREIRVGAAADLLIAASKTGSGQNIWLAERSVKKQLGDIREAKQLAEQRYARGL